MNLGMFTRQDATLWEDECATLDEGSPASQISLNSDDFEFPPCGCSTSPVPFEIPPYFDELVKNTKVELKAESKARLNEWVAKQQKEILESVTAIQRLGGLVAEAYRYETKVLTSAPIVEGEGGLTREDVEKLKQDTYRSYRGIMGEVVRATQSFPPNGPDGKPVMTIQQHRHNIANQGIHCLASMLPYSNGLCGAVTDARRAARKVSSPQVPLHILLDEGFHEMHDKVVENVPLPRGCAAGSTGRQIPVSMSAVHGKADKVSQCRRTSLASAKKATAAAKKSDTPRIKTPEFAKTPRRPIASLGLNSAVRVQHYDPLAAMV